MRKVYIALAILTGVGLWLLMVVLLLPWWVATLLIIIWAGVFWLEVAPYLRLWRPNHHSGWQRNALRWKRRHRLDD